MCCVNIKREVVVGYENNLLVCQAKISILISSSGVTDVHTYLYLFHNNQIPMSTIQNRCKLVVQVSNEMIKHR